MSVFILKVIALLTMIIDHIGYMGNLTWDNNIYFKIFRIVGRISFPLFAFLISEGCKHTRDLKKYMSRILIFAFIVEIPYLILSNKFLMSFFHSDSFLTYTSRNVLFTLFLGILTVYLYEKIKFTQFKLASPIIVIFTAFIAEALLADYGALGVLTIFLLYLSKTKQLQVLVILFFAIIQHNLIYFNDNIWYFSFAFLSSIFILFYNNKRGPSFKYLFYWMYPLHLMIIGIIWYIFFI